MSLEADLASFQEITSCKDRDQALAILTSHDFDLEESITYFFDHSSAIESADGKRRSRSDRSRNRPPNTTTNSILFTVDELRMMNLLEPPRKPVVTIDSAPSHIIQRIVSFLKLRDAVKLGLTSKRYQVIMEDAGFWHRMYWRVCAPQPRLFWNYRAEDCPHDLPTGVSDDNVRLLCLNALNESSRWLSSKPASVARLFEYQVRGPAAVRTDSVKKSKSPLKGDETDRITAADVRGMWAAYTTRSHKLHIRDARNGRLIRTTDTEHAEISSMQFVDYSNSSSVVLMAGSKDGSVTFWNLQSSKDPFFDKQMHDRPVHALSCGREWTFSGGVEGNVYGYHLPSLMQSTVDQSSGIAVWNPNVNFGSVECMLLSQDESMIVIGGGDRALSILQTPIVENGRFSVRADQHELVARNRLEGHSNLVLDMCWVQNGSVFASCGRDHSARVWSVRNGSCLASFERHSNMVNQVRSMDSLKLFTACEDKLVRRFDIEYSTLEAKYACGNFGPSMMEVDRTRLVTASTREPFLHVFDPRSEKRAGYLFPNASPTLETRLDGQPLGNISVMRILDDRRLLVGHKDGALYVYDFRMMQPVRT